MNPQGINPPNASTSADLDWSWPRVPTPQDWAAAIEALPRGDDFQPRTKASTAQSVSPDWSNPDVLSAYLRPPGQLGWSTTASGWTDAAGASNTGATSQPSPTLDTSTDAATALANPPGNLVQADGLAPATSPKGAVTYPLAWTNGVGSYQWEAPQVAVAADSSVTPTGQWGGRGSISTTNPNGIASTDTPDPQTGRIVRTFYDGRTWQSLGTFPVVPGQTIYLNDGKTTVSYGLPQTPSVASPGGSQVSSDINSIDDLRLAQAQFERGAQELDPLGAAYQAVAPPVVGAYRGLDNWMHHHQLPRVGDYMSMAPGADLNTAEIQADMLQAYVPEARGTRPGTANDILTPVSTLLTPIGGEWEEGAEPALEGLEVILGRVRGPQLDYIPRAPGLPPAQADLSGVPRFNPNIPSHIAAANAEERLANVVQSLPEEQVVRWGDPIGAHGADVVSVNTRTGDVSLWDAKYRGSDVRIQHSKTFEPTSDPAKQGPRENAIAEATRTLEADRLLPPDIRARALQNIPNGVVKTRTVGYGRARNSTIGN